MIGTTAFHFEAFILHREIVLTTLKSRILRDEAKFHLARVS